MRKNDELNKKLNIIISSSIFPNNQETTKGIYIYHQAKALSEFCNVKVVAPVPYFPSWIKSKTYNIYSKVLKFEKKEKIDVLHPRVLIFPKIGRSLYGILFVLSLFLTMRKLKRQFKPDVLLGYWVYPDGFANVILARILNIPVIIGGRGCDVNNSDRSFFIRRMVAWTLDSCDKVLAVSSAMKLKMIELNVSHSKIKVISNGLNSKFILNSQKILPIKKKKKSDNKKILYCGRLSPEKGLRYLIEAADYLNKKNRLFDLYIVGNGPDKKMLEQLVQSFGLENVVHFLGEMSQEKVMEEMNFADIFCLPSLREGWPNVVMEALACSLPVVATNVGGVPEIISTKEYGILVQPENSKALGDALEKALVTSWNYSKIKNVVAGRSWNKVAIETLNEICWVLKT